MRILLFGATGMVGQGVLRECLLDSGVTGVLAVGRTPTGLRHPKLMELAHADWIDDPSMDTRLLGFDACFFCLGASAGGRTEGEYAAVNYEIPVAVGTKLARLNPGMTFIYVSAAGTDSTEQGRMMWARVKGRTENHLLRLPLNAFMFRPAFIQPMHGEVSKTPAYRLLITAFIPSCVHFFRKGTRPRHSEKHTGRGAIRAQHSPGSSVKIRAIRGRNFCHGFHRFSRIGKPSSSLKKRAADDQ